MDELEVDMVSIYGYVDQGEQGGCLNRLAGGQVIDISRQSI